MIEATPIEPQEIVGSPKHQNLADGIEQLFTGAWNWLQEHLPNHDAHKPNALNSVKQAYDNAIAAVKADFDATAAKLKEEGATALQTAEQGAESAVQDAAGAVTAAQSPTPPSSTGSAPASTESASTTDTPTS